MTTEAYTREKVIELVKDGASLEEQKLKGIDLSKTDLRKARMRGAQFRYSDLRGADLSHADLRNANLRHVNLTKANLSEADLRGADLTHADIRGAVFVNAKLGGAKFGNTRGLSTKVFFPQTQLDAMAAKNEIDFQGEELIIASRSERWKITAAARVIGIEAGTDEKGILRKVLLESEMKEIGLEVYRNTAMLAEGDTVYKLENGMLGAPLHEIKKVEDASVESGMDPEQGLSMTPPAVTPSPAPVSAEERKKSDQELINDFLLKRLTS